MSDADRIRQELNDAEDEGETYQITNSAVELVREKDAEIARLRAEVDRLGDTRMGTHAEGCWDWGRSHYECARLEVERLRAEVAALKAVVDYAAKWLEDEGAGDATTHLRERLTALLARPKQPR